MGFENHNLDRDNDQDSVEKIPIEKIQSELRKILREYIKNDAKKRLSLSDENASSDYNI